jgi:hypothetical protein
MKRIVLEPEIETGDKFFFNDEEVIAERHYSSLSFQFRKKNGELLSMKRGINDLVVLIDQRFTIIESPEEQKTCEKKSFIEGKIDALTCLYEYINYFKLGSKEIKEIIKGNIDVFKKNLEQVADAGEATDHIRDATKKVTPLKLKEGCACGTCIEEVQPAQKFAENPNWKSYCQNTSSKEKEAVEHCECLNDVDSAFVEKEDVKYIACLECRKPIKNTTVAAKQKPEGNPFKVGEKVIAYSSCFEKPVTSVFRGKIEKIEGDCLGVNNCGSITWVHYKQCERVE